MTTRQFIPAMVTAMGLASLFCAAGGAPAEKPLYLDPSQPIDKRVEDLLGRMTLSEKVAQMNMPLRLHRRAGNDPAAKREACRKFARGTLVPGFGPGGGFFTLADNALPEGSREQAEYFNELQKIAVESTRLKIPLLSE